MKRRSFLGLLASLPFVAKAVEVDKVTIERFKTEITQADVDKVASIAENISHDEMDKVLTNGVNLKKLSEDFINANNSNRRNTLSS